MLRAQRFTFKGDEFAIKGEYGVFGWARRRWTVPALAGLTIEPFSISHPAGHHQTRLLFNQFIPSASAANAPPLASTSKPHTLLHKTPETPKALTTEEVDDHINSAFEIATYLRKNVVQGVRNEEGNFCEPLPAGMGGGLALPC